MSSGSGEVVAAPASGTADGHSNGAGGASAQTNNPLSRKLHKILETRLDNDKVSGAEPGRGRRLSGARVSSPLRRGPRTRGTRCSAGAGRVRRGGEEPRRKPRGFLGVTPI